MNEWMDTSSVEWILKGEEGGYWMGQSQFIVVVLVDP